MSFATQLLGAIRPRGQLDSEIRYGVIDELFVSGAEFPSYLRRFAVLMTLSVIIATYGMRDNSEAVVIGAMLIAPLMTPVLGVAASIVLGMERNLVKSAALIVGATSGAILLAWSLQLLAQQTEASLTPVLLGRTSPTIVDLGIALAAGAAGAYVQTRRKALASLPGVAIAVALVPPLAAVGMFIGLGAYDEAGGAFILYLTNLAGIVFAAALVFLAVGFTPRSLLERSRRSVGLGLAVALGSVLLIVGPLAYNSFQIYNNARDVSGSRGNVQDWLGEDTRLEIFRIKLDGDSVEVFLGGPGEPPDTDNLAVALAERLGAPLDVTVRWAPVLEETSSVP